MVFTVKIFYEGLFRETPLISQLAGRNFPSFDQFCERRAANPKKFLGFLKCHNDYSFVVLFVRQSIHFVPLEENMI